VGRQRSKNYTALLTDATKPLMNRATQAQYPPGSTFKTLEALVCQQLGGINENTFFVCNGPGSSPIKCTHHHGSPVKLLNAIEQSCNPYFWNAFKATVEKESYGKNNATFHKNFNLWRNAVKSFGLGEKFSDSDIYEQSRGNIPSEEYYNKVYKSESGWRAVTIRSLSIGQGEVLATPLQMANLVCAIANEGHYISPHLHKNDSMLQNIHHSGVEQRYFPIVKEGMWRVFESGTARYYKIPEIAMCGKTGTADNSHGKPHAFFVGFAPRENPQIAMCVVVENAGYGSTYAAPIFSLLVEKYLTGKVKRTDVETRIINTVTNQNVTEH
jgi:penicillin-binding protein 2